MEINWSQFKSLVQTRSLLMQWLTVGDNYHLKCFDNSMEINCIIPLDRNVSSDTVDFEDNFKVSANKKLAQNDLDGAIIIRPKAAKAGWTYSLLPVEFLTSKLNSVISKKHDNTDRSGVTYKIYDGDNVEITTTENEINAVKTVVDFEPSFDYELIGGQIQQFVKPDSDIRLWVVGVPDVSEAYGGTKEMVGGVNLKFIDPTDKIQADGRASKYMSYNATYHTNKLRIIIRHNAGIQHNLMLVLELFKA